MATEKTEFTFQGATYSIEIRDARGDNVTIYDASGEDVSDAMMGGYCDPENLVETSAYHAGMAAASAARRADSSVTVRVYDSYAIKDALRAAGAKFNSREKAWEIRRGALDSVLAASGAKITQKAGYHNDLEVYIEKQ